MPPAPTPGEPAPPEPEPATPREAQATLENAAELENVLRQELTNDIRQRIQRARDLVAQGQPEAALNTLRLAQIGRPIGRPGVRRGQDVPGP